MLVGEIIRYYREKKGISQSKLGEGICSKAYLSRFEGGKVAFSPDTISKLSERLSININKEIESLQLIDNRLKDWEHSMIMQHATQMKEIKLEIENMPLINSTKHAAYYLLLTARYYLYQKMLPETKYTIEYVEKKIPTLSNYERNLLLHIKGMYCLNTFRTIESEGSLTAVKILKQINIEEYNNEEYYYHLALAYHYANAKVQAYSNAELALQFFNKTYNYVNAINAQTLMLMQFESGNDIDFLGLINKYKDLIHTSEVVGAYENQLVLLNNIGEEFYKREEYEQAAQFFEQSLILTNSSSIDYLRRYYQYVKACTEGNILENKKLIEKIDKGIKLADKQCLILSTLFTLLSLKCKNNLNQYFDFLADVVLPQFKSTNNDTFYEQYGKKLYRHYIELKQYKKAVELAQNLRQF